MEKADFHPVTFPAGLPGGIQLSVARSSKRVLRFRGSDNNIVFVGARIKHVTIQTIGSGPYIPETLHVKLDQQRTDRTVANNVREAMAAPEAMDREMENLRSHDMYELVPRAGGMRTLRLGWVLH